MLKLFSHKSHFIKHCLSNAKLLFPGAKAVLGLYYDEDKQEVLACQNDDNGLKVVDLINFDDDKIEEYRMQKPPFSWVDQPFKPNKEEGIQLNIASELSKHTLLLRFPSVSSKRQDLLFVYFKNEEQIFSFGAKQQKLSTEIKNAVAQSFVRSLEVFRRSLINDKEIAREIAGLGLIRSRNGSDSAQNELIESIIKEHLDALLKEAEYSYRIDPSFSEGIVKMTSELKEIRASLDKILSIKINMGSDRDLLFTGEDLELLRNSKVRTEKKDDSAYAKVMRLLDRYEAAAIEVLKQGYKLTGANLGAHMSPSISAAAISDALRKNEKQIAFVLQSYPNRWEVLRKQFRPVQNRLNYSSSLAS